MARTWRNRTVGYDNIAVGAVYGLENIALAAATPAQNPVDDLAVGNFPQPENQERTGGAISPAASGLEKLTP